jgi:cytochrome c oxidase subunit 3
VSADPTHAEHFTDVATQRHAAKLGIWVFIGSEALFFAGLILLYCAARAVAPAEFAHGVAHGEKSIGTINTFVLLTSSWFVALAVDVVRRGRPKLAGALAALTAALGIVFVVLKGVEYAHHVEEGLLPGAVIDPSRGGSAFWTLYWVLTAFHAVHVIIGTSLLIAFSIRLLWKSKLGEPEHAFENVTIFWHFVDVVWIFLWPLFYLTSST